MISGGHLLSRLHLGQLFSRHDAPAAAAFCPDEPMVDTLLSEHCIPCNKVDVGARCALVENWSA